ncbi:HoxN/HupN/NixA family nickel/cobalt transporter [Microbacterium sp. ZW T6_19]|uniref:HoxN/HupN/NixA family nickel/cobalt transporter n=1 Tax=Microbacterium sp. ZW T6_19 TaxID=3378082 RepID=UPI0038521E86
MTLLTVESTPRLARPSTAIVLVAALHVLGWGTLLLTAAVAAPDGAANGLLATGLAAYALGLRHAFDADHIAAIDNTTRRLLERGLPARNVGTWFALGHSTVVFGLSVVLAWGAASVAGALAQDTSLLHQITGVWGPSISSAFLFLLAALGIGALLSRRRGGLPGGPVWRALSSLEGTVDRPSRMFGVGLLFGLGFDTATEIGLLALAGTAAATALPWWLVLALPVIFAAGMTALDTAQAAVAHRAYSFPDRERRTLSGYATWMALISVSVAVVVALVQLSGVASELWGWQGPTAWLSGLAIDDLGIWLTAALLITWLSLLAVTAVRARSARR